MDVKIDINPKGRYDDEKMEEKQEYEQPEKRDVMADINPDGEHNEEKTVGKQPYEQQAELDPREHLVKKNELKERVEQDEASAHWEEAKEEILEVPTSKVFWT
jgi:hypothetical protein